MKWNVPILALVQRVMEAENGSLVPYSEGIPSLIHVCIKTLKLIVKFRIQSKTIWKYSSKKFRHENSVNAILDIQFIMDSAFFWMIVLIEIFFLFEYSYLVSNFTKKIERRL